MQGKFYLLSGRNFGSFFLFTCYTIRPDEFCAPFTKKRPNFLHPDFGSQNPFLTKNSHLHRFFLRKTVFLSIRHSLSHHVRTPNFTVVFPRNPIAKRDPRRATPLPVDASIIPVLAAEKRGSSAFRETAWQIMHLLVKSLQEKALIPAPFVRSRRKIPFPTL